VATLIDASLLIAAERGRLDWDAVAAAQGEEGVAVAAITASELLHGVHRAADPTVRTRRSAFVERVLGQIPVISFDVVVARVHARVWAELAAKGAMVGAHDLLIGATALATGGRVATRDLRSFPKIPGLDVVRW
jgi:tRNA(fMet)-specific endonuclease VapC